MPLALNRVSPGTPIPKPQKKIKTKTPMKRGGARPKEQGRRFERDFANKYDFHRQVGSGAFAASDMMLQGDVTGEIGRLKLLFELKSWNMLDGKGEKIVTFPLNLIDKITKEAESLGREPILVYHPKNTNIELAVVPYLWLDNLIRKWENEIKQLNDYIARQIHLAYLEGSLTPRPSGRNCQRGRTGRRS